MTRPRQPKLSKVCIEYLIENKVAKTHLVQAL